MAHKIHEGLYDIHVPTLFKQFLSAGKHPRATSRVERLLSQASSLVDKFKQGNGIGYIEEAIALDRAALDLCAPTGTDSWPKRFDCLVQLATHLQTRYNQLGGTDDINEMIALARDAVALCPPGYPDRSVSLRILANSLWVRYTQFGGVDDLYDAMIIDREALVLRPPGHPDRVHSLIGLAIDLYARYEELGELDDLDEAIILDRDAVAICPPGDPFRWNALTNLGVHLWGRYKLLGSMEDLNAAIDLNRDALALCPPGHLNRSTCLNSLAASLSSRYTQFGTMEDLNEAIYLGRNALALRPQGHPARSSCLESLADHIHFRYKQLGDPEDRDQIFRLYTDLAYEKQLVSSSDLKAAKAWINTAEAFDHPMRLFAYETALRILVQHLATVPSLPQHLTLLTSLSSSLAVDAFSVCLRMNSPTKAVELLEQGRGVFWAQLTRLRCPTDDVVASGPEGKRLADEFARLTSLIRQALASPGADQYNRVWSLNVELQKIASSIRQFPGLSRFLLPSLFSDLQRAASEGPVIIVNASEYSCDALVVLADKHPVHIPLPVTKEEVGQMSSRLRTMTKRAKKMDVTRELGLILRELWDRVVSPIVDLLRPICPLHSRIWWCPTAEFSLLPFHSTGPYRKGERNLSSLYISSYTSTLTALIRARRPRLLNSVTQKRFIGIGQGNAIGSGTWQLASVGAELFSIGQRVEDLAMFTCIEGQDSCISRVADELSENEWVHLACHGLPNRKQPFDSAFALYDGHFTIQRIIQCDLKNPEFAYLSTSQTTVGYEESPDEVIHLASAMQFAGFRSVIGTMWAVDDGETTKITSEFYKHMVDDSGRLDHTRAAYALGRTMRSVNAPLDQKVLYVHIGA